MRINRTITVTAGTPVNVASGLTTAYVGPAIYARAVFIQMRTAGTGRGYVIDGVQRGQVANQTVHGCTAELIPASATGPGGSYSDNEPNSARVGSIDVTKIWVDGSHTGDTILASYDGLE